MENFGLYDEGEGQLGAGSENEPGGETPDVAGLKSKPKSAESSPETGGKKKKQK